MSENSDHSRPPFDKQIVSELLGARILVGVTRLDHEGRLIEQIQYHGKVVVADACQGFCLKLEGLREGDYEWLPPDTSAFSVAGPGEYRLHSTGEVVEDIDFLTTWTSNGPDPYAK